MLDLSQPWRSYPVLSVDFECTGKDQSTCEPVEVSCVRFEQGAIVARYTTLLRTKDPIPADAVAVHGITDEMVRDAPTIEEVAHHLVDISADAVPLAFNRAYDRTVMHRYLNGEGVTLFDPMQPWLCSYAMAWSADRFEAGSGRHKLAACCERRGIRVVGAHRAEADAIASGMLFFALMAGADKPTMAQVLARVAAVEVEREKDWAAFQKKLREADRLVWRQYAAAAATGIIQLSASVEDCCAAAAQVADEMLKLEKERFK